MRETKRVPSALYNYHVSKTVVIYIQIHTHTNKYIQMHTLNTLPKISKLQKAKSGTPPAKYIKTIIIYSG